MGLNPWHVTPLGTCCPAAQRLRLCHEISFQHQRGAGDLDSGGQPGTFLAKCPLGGGESLAFLSRKGSPFHYCQVALRSSSARAVRSSQGLLQCLQAFLVATTGVCVCACVRVCAREGAIGIQWVDAWRGSDPNSGPLPHAPGTPARSAERHPL